MSERLVAEGANRYRRAGWLERAAARARGHLGPSLREPLKRVYHTLLRLQTGGRGLECALPGGETIRVLPEYAHLSWNPDEYRAFREAVRPGAVALDIGANAGAYALVLGRWVGPSGHVYAFEPVPASFDGLARHVALNGLVSTVTPVRAAVGDREGPAPLRLAGTPGESRLAGSATADDGATVDVDMTTIDAFCARTGIVPDFIKIDVEGAELDVLRGARETLRARGPSLALFVELHPSIWTTMGLTPERVLAGIRELGLEPERPWAEALTIEGLCVRLSPVAVAGPCGS
jgi:FkbM family methyltransferase